MVSREVPLALYAACRTATSGVSERQMVVLWHDRLRTSAEGTHRNTKGMCGLDQERASGGRFPHEPTPFGRTDGLGSMSC